MITRLPMSFCVDKLLFIWDEEGHWQVFSRIKRRHQKQIIPLAHRGYRQIQFKLNDLLTRVDYKKKRLKKKIQGVSG